MKRTALLVVLLLLVVVPISLVRAQAPRMHYGAILTGDEQVPRVATRAFGTAVFEVQPGGNAIRYWLTVVDIANVQMAHIHIGAPGEAGPVAVWLYPAAPPPRPIPGVTSDQLAEGTFTAANFVGPLARQPMSALLTAIAQGNAYVNVHTAANPGGEIRGQIR
jgi:hypothetical protein